MKKRLFSTILIFTVALTTLAGCSKKEEPMDVRASYFEALKSSLSFETGEYQIDVDMNYEIEDETKNPMASSLVDKTQVEKIGANLKGIVNDSTVTLDLSVTSTETGIKDLNLLDLIVTDTTAYLNVSKMMTSMTQLFLKANQDEFKGTELEEILLYEETYKMMVEEYKDLLQKSYLMVSLNDLVSKADEYGTNRANLTAQQVTDAMKVSKDFSKTLYKAEMDILYQLIKATENSYETTIVQYDEENGYFYIEMNYDLYKDFNNRLSQLIANNKEQLLNSVIESYQLNAKLEEFKKAVELLNSSEGVTVEDTEELTPEYIKQSLSDFMDAMVDTPEEIEMYKDGKVVCALFPLQNGYKHVIQAIQNEHNDATISMVTINNPEVSVTLPTEQSTSLIDVLMEMSSGLDGMYGDMYGDYSDFGSSSQDEYVKEENQIVVILEDDAPETALQTIQETAGIYGKFSIADDMGLGMYLITFDTDYTADQLEDIADNIYFIEGVQSSEVNYMILMDDVEEEIIIID